MDLSRLGSELKYIEINGVTLNIDERTRLDIGCMELANEIKANKIYFWGKIRGTIKDYFVVYTCNETLPSPNMSQPQAAHLPKQDYYWCSSSNYIFSSLPCVDADKVKCLSELPCLFSGEFDTILMESKDTPKVLDANAGIILPPKHVTELDRLSATVRTISRECCSVPRGALKYTPLHQVTCNEAFKGLKKDNKDGNDHCAFSLEGWQHARQPECKEQIE